MEAKQEVRERVWQTLQDEGAARFPGGARPDGARRRSPGIIWDHLDDETVEAIPVLNRP